MKRSIIFFIAIVLGTIVPASSALAEDPAPTKEQLDQAKKAFGEGKALYDEKKFPEAVEKFKESYRLSRNPLLLYNIGHTLDQAGQKDKALFPSDALAREVASLKGWSVLDGAAA